MVRKDVIKEQKPIESSKKIQYSSTRKKSMFLLCIKFVILIFLNLKFIEGDLRAL